MKRAKNLAFYLMAMFTTLSLYAGGMQENRIQVDFSDPARFLDIALDNLDTERGRQAVLDKVRSVFLSESQKYLPGGYRLKVQVRDIDLAGGFERWPPGANHGRIYRDIYPPRIEFEYEVLDTSGQVVVSGDEYLYNLAYLLDANPEEYRSVEDAYEVSALIRDWVKGTLARMIKEYVS